MTETTNAAPRSLFYGWGLLVVMVLAEVPLAMTMVGDYGGGPVEVRPWMSSYNVVVCGTHIALLGVVAYGVHRRGGLPSWARRGGVALFGLAALAALSMALFAQVKGGGPFPPDSPEVRQLRALVFLPSLLRDLGWLLLAVGLARLGRYRRAFGAIILLASLSVGLQLETGLTMATDVVARLHTHATSPLALAIWLAGSALFVWTLESRRADT